MKLAGLYALLFCLSTAILGVVSTAVMDASLRRQIDRRITADMESFTTSYAEGGRDALTASVKARMAQPHGLHYRLETGDGKLLAGGLAATGHGPGWFDFGVAERDAGSDTTDNFRGVAVAFGGDLLTIAEDTDAIEDGYAALISAFAAAGLLTTIFALAGGLWLSRLFLQRLGELSATAQAITEGALARRMPVTGSNDEFDALSKALNRMLDRNAALLDAQRQVATGIAHDIRTPLTRLRQTLEAPADGDFAAARSSALEEADNLLSVFSALLRIAECEEGAPATPFGDVDLAEVARAIGEAYAADFEDRGKSLTVAAPGPVIVRGDRGLLVQLLSNLVENALVHTPAGTPAKIVASLQDGAATLRVSDRGQGIPASELHLVFDRFYRTEQSRHLPGNGLGLSLVRSIAGFHGARVVVRNADPGLSVILSWPNDNGPANRPPGHDAIDGSFDASAYRSTLARSAAPSR